MGGGAVPVAHSKVNIDPSTRLRKASKCRNGSVAVEPSAVEHTWVPQSCRPEFRSSNPASLENSSSPFGHTLHAATYSLTSSDLIIDSRPFINSPSSLLLLCLFRHMPFAEQNQLH